MTIHDITIRLNSGEPQSLGDYRGRVLLIVNVASQCGFTPQYAGLQALQAQFHHQGFHVLAFPCDQFGHQEPGSDAEIAVFCSQRFGVTFSLAAKIDVNGPRADALFVHLKSQKGGLLGSAIKWNFTKFLVGRDGTVLERFPPTTKPKAIARSIELALMNGADGGT